MDEEKKCPINPDTQNEIDCIEGRCAWWDEDAQACAVLVLAREVRKVNRHGR